MGSAASFAQRPQGFDSKDDAEWAFYARMALKNPALQEKFILFLRGAGLGPLERNCVRLYMELEHWATLCQRKMRYLGLPKESKTTNKIEDVNKEIRERVERIVNTYAVTDARRRVPLSRHIINQIGLISADIAGGGGSGGTSSMTAPLVPNSLLPNSLGFSGSSFSNRGSFMMGTSTGSTEFSPSTFGPREVLAFISEVEYELLPLCKGFITTFLQNEENAHLVQDALLAAEEVRVESLDSKVAAGSEPTSGSPSSATRQSFEPHTPASPPSKPPPEAFPAVAAVVARNGSGSGDEIRGASPLDIDQARQPRMPPQLARVKDALTTQVPFSPEATNGFAVPFSPDGPPSARNSRDAATTHMLVVDDSYPMLKMLSFALTREGVQVTGAQDGETALELLKKETYDAVLIDLQMPKMDGYQLAYQFRKFELQKKNLQAAPTRTSPRVESTESGGEELIPFVASITASAVEGDSSASQRALLIAMSSDWSDEIETKVHECGMDLFLKKPLTAKAVADLLRSRGAPSFGNFE